MKDFTVKIYQQLLRALSAAGYDFQTFSDFLEHDFKKMVILRHDVDTRKQNSLHFARIQAKAGIQGSYYFRIVPESFNEEIITEIASLGHEIGYHYETMDTASGNIDKAYDEFCRNLDTFRKIVPVKTICMHGSPLSKYDNRSLWDKYDYKALGILGEPYFDIDFKQVMYLTDTGRRWDGASVSVRDKVQDKINPQLVIPNLKIHSTNDIISAVRTNKLPDRIMFTFHPQRWTDKMLPWIQELVWQNLKNVIKQWIVKQP